MIHSPSSHDRPAGDGEQSRPEPGHLPDKGVASGSADHGDAFLQLTKIIDNVVLKVRDQRLLFAIGISTILSLVVAILAVNGQVNDTTAIIALALIAGLAVLALVLPSGSARPHRRTGRHVGWPYQLALLGIGAFVAASAATVSVAVFQQPSALIDLAVKPSVEATAIAMTASIEPTIEAAVIATQSAGKDIVIKSGDINIIKQDGYYPLKPGQRLKVSLTQKGDRLLKWQIVSPPNPEFHFEPVESTSQETELIIPQILRDKKIEAQIKVSEYDELRRTWSSEAVYTNIVIE